MKIRNIEKNVINKLPISDESKNILTRRIKKLRRDPKGFLESSFEKRSGIIKDALPIRYNSSRNYTIITAAYNSEKYLEDYFRSITNQSLKFKNNIKIICVDDGSTDRTAEIIKRWQKNYQENIIYLYKENGGQASARNLGLENVDCKTDWVTFIDSDDFLPKDYFYEVDKSIEKNDNIRMVGCNQIYYFEETDSYIDRHPFNYRFKSKNNIVSCRDMKKNVQFSAALSFLHFGSIPKSLKFDEQMKPTFEDGKFINMFLLSQKENSLAYFNPNAKYFNRKREDKSSTMDGVWLHKGQFSTVLENGYLDILAQSYKNLGYIPKHLQRSILWEMLRLVKHLLNHEERVDFLTCVEKNKLIYLMKECFKYIDKDTIMSYELGNCGFSRQLGMLGTFKGMDVDRQVAYIDKVDINRNMFLLRFFSCFDVTVNIYTENENINPIYYKKSDRKFLSETFLVEHRLWLKIPDNGNLIVEINNKNAFINFNGQKYKSGIVVSDLNQDLSASTLKPIWVLMDRDDQAGDNAEFLYEYIQRNYINQEIYFVINEESPDWWRLNNKRFNLIGHGTPRHKEVLEQCSLLISSQCGFIIEPFDKLNSDYKRVFLQHGVIKDNLSNWLNNVKTDLMITSTLDEYESIVNDHTQYVLGKNEVKLTGLPRFDSLYKNMMNNSRNVLIMFTWRKDVTGSFISNEKSVREFNNDFKETYYYKAINSLLNNSYLEYLSKTYKFNFVLCPHPNMQPYLRIFDIPDYVKVAGSNESIHDLINSSAMVVTDYSSIAFDFAYQNKPVAYYQFDKESFFNGEHTYTEGYFDYTNDGFGPIESEEDYFIARLEEILASDCKPAELYAKRIDSTFESRDDSNCERVFEAIISLNQPEENLFNIDVLLETTLQAFKAEAWDLVESRVNLLIKHAVEEQRNWAVNILKESLFHQNKFSELLELIDSDVESKKTKDYWRAKIAFATANWQDAIDLINSFTITNNETIFMLLLSYAATGNVNDFERVLREISGFELNAVQSIMIEAWSLRLHKEWNSVIQLLESEIFKFSLQQLRDYQPQILMAQAYRHLSKYAEAHQQLVDFERHTAHNITCRIEIARLAFSRENYGKCINQYEQAVNGTIEILSEKAVSQYLLSHWYMNNIEDLVNILPDIILAYPNNTNFKRLYILVLTEQSKWIEVIEEFSKIGLEQQAEVIYSVTLAKYRLGYIDAAYDTLRKPNTEDPYEYWFLVAEIALLMEDIDLVRYCYKMMIAIFPNTNKQETIQKLMQLNSQKT